MDFIKYITQSNLPPYLLFFAIIILGTMYFFRTPISTIITKISFKKSKESDIKDLKSHDLFSTLERVKKEVSFMKFYTHTEYDSVKTQMCKDFTDYKCDLCTKHFTIFLDNNFDNMNFDELKTIILKEMYLMHENYIKETKNHWLSKGISNEDTKYIVELFEKFRYDVVVSFQHRIDAIFACTYYKNNFEKILACYEMFSMGIDLLPRDMQTTFESLNGKFAKINYN